MDQINFSMAMVSHWMSFVVPPQKVEKVEKVPCFILTVGFSATLVFPEATTSNNESILPFRTGAFVSGAPVKIVCFSYESYDFDPCYCGLGPLVLWTMLCEPVLRLKVRSLPLYHPSEEERKDPTLYAQNVRIEMHKVTGLPFSELSFADRVDRNLSRENLNVKKLT